MNELIDELKIRWSSFRDVFDISIWNSIADLICAGIILIIKVRKEEIMNISDFYKSNHPSEELIVFGDFIVILGYRTYAISYLEDLFIIKDINSMTIEDKDCLFVYSSECKDIACADDLLNSGRWILIDKVDEYGLNQIEIVDSCELEYLFSKLVKSNYYGMKNIMRIIDLIESKKKYEYLSLLIGSGLDSCPNAYKYVLSYLKYLKNQQGYYDLDLIKMLFRFCFHGGFVDKEVIKDEFENAFPGKDIFEVMEGVYYYMSDDYCSYWEQSSNSLMI
ncbi:MAG: hypothetical protein KMY54_01590 [Erysipelothrix sp.]|nr:hypothetical protein [Erysipelothrix sp.]